MIDNYIHLVPLDWAQSWKGAYTDHEVNYAGHTHDTPKSEVKPKGRLITLEEVVEKILGRWLGMLSADLGQHERLSSLQMTLWKLHHMILETVLWTSMLNLTSPPMPIP